MESLPPQLQYLPDKLHCVPWFLASYGAIWPHTFFLNEEDVTELLDLNIVRAMSVSTGRKVMTLLVAGPSLRRYVARNTDLHRPPVAHHAIEVASLIDLAMPYYHAQEEVRIDRRRRCIRAGDNENICMVRLRPPTIRTLSRNESDDSLFLYVPPRHVNALIRRAERAELYTGSHHNLIVRPFDVDAWPPRETDG